MPSGKLCRERERARGREGGRKGEWVEMNEGRRRTYLGGRKGAYLF
jgi:hypothetical protein